MKGVWHIRIGKYARAFVPRPDGCNLVWLLARGWRPFNRYWWSKPSGNQSALERQA